jgi:hypothetical protein
MVNIFEESDDPVFYRMHILNEMLAMSKTDVVINYDCDVILPVNSYVTAYNSILNKESQLKINEIFTQSGLVGKPMEDFKSILRLIPGSVVPTTATTSKVSPVATQPKQITKTPEKMEVSTTAPDRPSASVSQPEIRENLRKRGIELHDYTTETRWKEREM